MNFELITAKYDCRCSLTGKNFSRGDQVYELITAKYDCRCSLTGKNFCRGDQVYYNYEAKTFLDPVYHENIMSQQKSRGMKSYFERHQKLNKIYPTQKP